MGHFVGTSRPNGHRPNGHRPNNHGHNSCGLSESETDAIVQQGLVLAGEMGWERFQWHDLAERSGLALDRIWQFCPSKAALLKMIVFHVSETARIEALSDLENSPEDLSTRDILIDVLVRGFEQLVPYHKGFCAIWHSHSGSWTAACHAASELGPTLSDELAKIRDVSKVSRGTVGDGLCTVALVGLLVKAAHKFTAQDSPSIEPIMAELDRGTLRIWQILERMGYPDIVRDRGPQDWEIDPKTSSDKEK